MILGSAQYVSPEQVAGGKITPSSDIYSLGVVLYESITGQRPFDGPSPAAVALERLHVRPAPPSAVAHDLPPAIDALVLRALERDPGARYPSAGDFAAALESWRLGLLGGVRRGGAGPRDAQRGTGRDGGAFAAGATVGAVATAAVAGSGAGAFPPVRTGRLGRGGGPPTGRTVRPTARDRDRRPRLAPLLLLPVGAFALLALAALALLGSLERQRGRRGRRNRHAARVGLRGRAALHTRGQPDPDPDADAHTDADTDAHTDPDPDADTGAHSNAQADARPDPPASELTPRPAPAQTPPGSRPRPCPASTASSWRSGSTTRPRCGQPRCENATRRRGTSTGVSRRRRHIDLRRNEIIAFDPDAGTATVAVDIIEYRESGPSPRRFVGDWDLVLVDGRWLMNDPDF